jgi:hypothetical protein
MFKVTVKTKRYVMMVPPRHNVTLGKFILVYGKDNWDVVEWHDVIESPDFDIDALNFNPGGLAEVVSHTVQCSAAALAAKLPEMEGTIHLRANSKVQLYADDFSVESIQRPKLVQMLAAAKPKANGPLYQNGAYGKNVKVYALNEAILISELRVKELSAFEWVTRLFSRGGGEVGGKKEGSFSYREKSDLRPVAGVAAFRIDKDPKGPRIRCHLRDVEFLGGDDSDDTYELLGEDQDISLPEDSTESPMLITPEPKT